MAAKVASGAQGSTEREEGPGVSYASILNPKSGTENCSSSNKDNNKENIGSQVQTQQSLPMKDRIASQNLAAKGKSYQRNGRRLGQPSKQEKRYGNEAEPFLEQSQPQVYKECPIEQQQETIPENDQINGDIGSDGEFQTVAPKSARRKEKLREQQREHRERHRHRDHRHPLRGHSRSNERPYKERDRGDRTSLDHLIGNKETFKDREDPEGESEVQPTSTVKYIEAPIPAVNPWTKSKTTTQAAPSNCGSLAGSDKQSEKEKRVLQPQQQGIVGKYSFSIEFLTFFLIEKYKKI